MNYDGGQPESVTLPPRLGTSMVLHLAPCFMHLVTFSQGVEMPSRSAILRFHAGRAGDGDLSGLPLPLQSMITNRPSLSQTVRPVA